MDKLEIPILKRQDGTMYLSVPEEVLNQFKQPSATLNEEIIKQKDADIDALKTENATLKEELAKTPKSIADFSPEDRAVYFSEWVKSLTPEGRALLHEELDIRESVTVPTVPGPDTSGQPGVIKVTLTK
ncbi:MAG: hypothetical protein JW967_02435 [Dehalococcoidales bacterium]|nr:hypothetical protein [Dehalococcoidales bacterium]